MSLHNETGKWGEKLATEFLIKKGYDIVERNWRLNHLEIDIIARHQQRIVFVEVKTRTDKSYAEPQTVISQKKLRNLCSCAQAYMKRYNMNFEAQFDIIIITGTPENNELEFFPDAYFPPMKTYR